MQNEEGGGAALGGEMLWNAMLSRRAGIDQNLECMASDRAQWRDMLALLVF